MSLQKFKIKKGLDLPIRGAPEQVISDGPLIRRVALLGDDYVGMKPTMAVQEGDVVKLGQLLFSDKKTPGVQFTSPGAGRVAEIRRGERRAFQSIVIELDAEGDGGKGNGGEVEFGAAESPIAELPRSAVRDKLVASGLWTSFRTRPFGKIPPIDSVPHSIFVTAIDTQPLAADPTKIITLRRDDFLAGLRAIRRLSDGKLFLCRAGSSTADAAESRAIQDADLRDIDVTVAEFEGPHPAGLAGTHIHFLDPVSARKTVWSIGYQDVIAIGYLFRTGRILTERVIAMGGPVVKSPRLLRTRLGASVDDLFSGELADGENRQISGSVLSGRKAVGPLAYLGRYHQQASALAEGNQREFLGWMGPGANKFSVLNVFLSRLFRGKKFALTTSLEGSSRPMVPLGMYEKVMPLDIQPTFLLRALITDDSDQAQALGCLELDEEDLSLCTLVCTGKYEYGPILRRNLTAIEKEG